MSLMRTHLRQAIALYRDGSSIASIADRLNAPRNDVRKALKETNAVELRTRGRPVGFRPPKPTPTPEERIMRGQTLWQIAMWDARRRAALDELAAYHGWNPNLTEGSRP